MFHGSQEWGGKGLGRLKMVPKSVVGMVCLGRLKMKHEKGVGCFSWFPRVGWEGLGKAQNGSQECCGNGLGRPRVKHEKGLRASWRTRVGLEGLGKFKIVSKSVVGMVWESQK